MNNQKLNELVARCSKYSGFNLVATLENGPKLTIADPNNFHLSALVLTLGVGGLFVHEAYGRMHHWAITREEQEILRQVLLAG